MELLRPVAHAAYMAMPKIFKNIYRGARIHFRELRKIPGRLKDFEDLQAYRNFCDLDRVKEIKKSLPELETRPLDVKMLTSHYINDKNVFPTGPLAVNGELNLLHWDHINRGVECEQETKEWIPLVRANTMVFYDSFLAMANIVKYCDTNNIPGRIVETGTWKGGSLAFLGKAHLTWGNGERELWGFDSFEGIHEPHADHDPMPWAEEAMKITKEECTGKLRSINVLVAAQSDVLDVIDRVGFPRNKLKLFKGWFQETLPQIPDEEIGEIAILRLDGDLYESTVVCLEKFEPHVVDGGFIIIDDWSLVGARKAVTEYYLKKYGQMPFVHFIDSCSRYIQVAKK